MFFKTEIVLGCFHRLNYNNVYILRSALTMEDACKNYVRLNGVASKCNMLTSQHAISSGTKPVTCTNMAVHAWLKIINLSEIRHREKEVSATYTSTRAISHIQYFFGVTIRSTSLKEYHAEVEFRYDKRGIM